MLVRPSRGCRPWLPAAATTSSLPRAYGTNFPTPADPHGLGFSNQTAIGWDGSYWPVFEYLSGSFFARGVNSTYNSGGTTLCGAMYSFSAYVFGATRPPSRCSGPRTPAICRR